MHNKLFIVVSILVFFLFFVATQQCPADMLERLEQAETYKWYPAQAEEICRQIKADYPASQYALTAHKNLVISYLSAKRDTDAEQSLNQLTADFAGNSGLPAALYDVAKIYERARKYEAAKGLYQQIAEQYPNSTVAAQVQLDLPKMDILSCIESKKYNETAEGIDNLIADFNDHTYLPSALYDIARRYERAKKYTEAENLYNRINNQYPESFGADILRLALGKIDIYSLIRSENTEVADAAIIRLLADFVKRPNLSEALYDIAIRYDRVKNYEQAKNIYQKITEKFPTSSHAARAPLDISRIEILSLMDSGDEPNAAAAIDSLIADYSGHSHLTKALFPIARRCRDSGKYEQQYKIYDQIITDYPDSFFAERAWLLVSKMDVSFIVELGKADAVGPAVDELIADFNKHPKLPHYVFQIGKYYYDEGLRNEFRGLLTEARENFEKAIAVWAKVVENLPFDVVYTTRACYLSARCYYRMGQEQKAIDYCQRLITNWPEHEDAGKAQFLMGECFERQRDSAVIPESEATHKIEQAYTAVVEKYSSSLFAKHALLKLGWMRFGKGRWREAAGYWERSLEKFPQESRPVNILYPLGRAYEEIGQLDKAARVYEQFIQAVDLDDPRIETVIVRLENLALTK